RRAPDLVEPLAQRVGLVLEETAVLLRGVDLLADRPLEAVDVGELDLLGRVALGDGLPVLRVVGGGPAPRAVRGPGGVRRRASGRSRRPSWRGSRGSSRGRTGWCRAPRRAPRGRAPGRAWRAGRGPRPRAPCGGRRRPRRPPRRAPWRAPRRRTP